MRIAITGGTGFVGGHLADRLARDGHETVILSRRTGDGLDVGADRLADALEGCDAVVHCAGINREIGDQTYDAVHVRGTEAVIEAARAAGVGRIVMLSFLRARPDGPTSYHRSKWAAEELVRASGLTYTVLKAGVIHGRGDHMLDHLSHAFHTFPVFGLVGLHDRDVRPVAVDDVTRLLAAAALGDPRLADRTIAVLGPETMPLGEAVRRVARVDRSPAALRPPAGRGPSRRSRVVAEATMRVPLISIAQVRILAEGVVEAGTVRRSAASRPGAIDAVLRRGHPRGPARPGRLRPAPTCAARHDTVPSSRRSSTPRSSDVFDLARDIDLHARSMAHTGRAGRGGSDERTDRPRRDRHVAGPPLRDHVVAHEPDHRSSSDRRGSSTNRPRARSARSATSTASNRSRAGHDSSTIGSTCRRSACSDGWSDRLVLARYMRGLLETRNRVPQGRGRSPRTGQVVGSGMNGPSAVETATNSGNAVVDVDLARGDPLGPTRRRELEDELLAVEGRGALAGEGPALQQREVGELDRRVEGRQLGRRDRPEDVRRLSGSADGPVRVHDDRRAARALEALAASASRR